MPVFEVEFRADAYATRKVRVEADSEDEACDIAEESAPFDAKDWTLGEIIEERHAIEATDAKIVED
jgi:hypothetical protein